MHPLEEIIRNNKRSHKQGIYSCCSANEFVLKAAAERAKETGSFLLIEATANQVNQYGGYTGMTPSDFSAYVSRLVKQIGLPREKLILGGDHLGPLTFSDLPEEEAMRKAEELVRAYVLAGFTKIHLDTSMKTASDSKTAKLSDATIASRGARLCSVCEEAHAKLKKTEPEAMDIVYIVGSEVPIPGGAQEKESTVSVTKKEAAVASILSYRNCFEKESLHAAWERVIGLVVQPGVEFGDSDIFNYDRAAASQLSGALHGYEKMTYEAHSTDYQTKYALKEMVEDGFAILKVGPALTFALREALFSLSMMENEMSGLYGFEPSEFRAVLEHEMRADNSQWKRHYSGRAEEVGFKLDYSFSDRARYYLPRENVNSALRRMLRNMDKREIPLALLSQYMPSQYSKVREHRLRPQPVEIIIDRVKNCIDDYLYATGAI